VSRLSREALLVLAAFIAVPLHGSDSQSQDQFWPEVDAYVGLTQNSRLFIQYSATREKELHDYAEGQVAAYLDVFMHPILFRTLEGHTDKSRSRLLLFRVGYAYSRSPATGNSKASTDHIPTVEATVNARLPWDILLSDRSRGDLRFQDGVFRPRYRNRLKFERTFGKGRSLITPYADSEVFYDARYDAFDEVRYTGGLEWSPVHQIVIDAYYTRQRSTKSEPAYVNAAGIKLELFLRNRR
jgi:hypothetical protein